MDIQSVKTRFMGSYVLLIILFVAQIPMIYLLVGGMSAKYTQVEEAGSLRKRAIEINYLLNRHIINGEEQLEKEFQAKKKEFGEVIENLKNGHDGVAAIKDREVAARIEALKGKWAAMDADLVAAMEDGDKLSDTVTEIEKTTPAMVDKFSAVVKALVALKDPSYSRDIDLAGLQRMRSVNLSYLSERYTRSQAGLEEIRESIRKTVEDSDRTIAGLRSGSAELGLRAIASREALEKLKEAEEFWARRKGMVLAAMQHKDKFRVKITEISDVRTPEVVRAADEVTKLISGGAERTAMKGIAVMVVSVLLSTAVAAVFMWYTNGQVIRPIIRIKEAVEGFTSGDLTRRAGIRITMLGKDLDDEITKLGSSVDSMAVQMSNVVGRITDSANHLASASEELSTSTNHIDEGANRQSGQTAQVATAMEEMSATVIEVAKNSQQAAESARAAQTTAANGGAVVTQAIEAMKEVAESTSVTAETIKKLGKSSEEIGAIISVINDIADQTNLLALNAAIEAARAGEQGRGFAVVADEVRKLAERTSKATKEIGGMIKSIQDETSVAVKAMSDGTDKVENGVRLANEAGDSLNRIVAGVESVTEMIGHIATSAEEQSATTEEITQSMDSISEVAKSNVSSIGEVAKASTELAQLATELKALVSNFKVDTAGAEGAQARHLRLAGGNNMEVLPQPKSRNGRKPEAIAQVV